MVIANLAPVAGVLILRWNVAAVIFLYWAENLIIGFYNILKTVFVPPSNPIVRPNKPVVIAFFCFHYGMFCLWHGLVLLTIFGAERGPGTPFPQELPSGISWLGELFGTLLSPFWGGQLLWPFLALAVSHGISFVQNYFRNGERKRITLADLMLNPYRRVVILHVAILVAGVFVAALRSPLPLLLLFVLLKIGLDIHIHNQSHRRVLSKSL